MNYMNHQDLLFLKEELNKNRKTGSRNKIKIKTSFSGDPNREHNSVRGNINRPV